MGEDRSGKKESRAVLGDITNQFGKRGFSLISRSPPSKSKSSNSQNGTDDTDTDSNFWKQVSLVVEKLEKERNGSSAKCPKISTNDAGLSPLQGGKTYRLLNSSKNLPIVGQEVSSSALDNIDLDAVNVGESCVSETKAGETSKCCQKESVEGDNCTPQGIECLSPPSKSDSIVSSRLAPEIKGFGLERCTAFNGDGLDSIKHCSCSFCTKAGYIWSDLHYQDVKGRISVLAKSQKEASNLAQKFSVENETGSQAQENFTNVAQLETDLTNHWKSLFLHMEDIFASEGTHLQNNFHALNDLREDYKMNLEMVNGAASDVQQCSSDASDHAIV